MNDYSFPRSRRLLKKAEFDRVFARRRSQGDGMLVLYAAINDLEYSRIGLVVSRKVGNSVVRSRWKRCIREAFRHAQHELPAGLDFVIVPRAGATPTMPRIQSSLLTLAHRLERQLR